MKIDSVLFPGRAPVVTKPSFGSLLKQVPPGLQKKTPPPLPPPAIKPNAPAAKAPAAIAAKSAPPVFTRHEKSTATLSAARVASHQHAAGLQEARAAGQQLSTQRVDSRLLDLICKELVIEFTSEPSKSRVANQDLPLPPPIATATPAVTSVPLIASEAARPIDATVKAAQAIELIEKIETFIKDSRRPTIALTLNNSLGAKVEIERVGPREVALKVIGHKGPPGADEISRIRDEMRAHGLKVCALSVA